MYVLYLCRPTNVHGVFYKAYYSNAHPTHKKALNGCFPLFAQVCILRADEVVLSPSVSVDCFVCFHVDEIGSILQILGQKGNH